MARVRPDTSITSKQYGAVAKKVTAATLDTALTEGRVWFRSGGGSDCFAVMTRAALDGYRTIWEEVSLPKPALLLSPCLRDSRLVTRRALSERLSLTGCG